MKKLLALLVVSLAAPLVATACDGATDTPVASADIQGIQADLVTSGMVSYLTANGVREGRVEADTAYAFYDSATVRLVGMRLIFYNEDGSERATVTAERGQLDENSDRMLAQGNVLLIVHQDGRRIESSEINYDPDQNRIWSDSATVQTTADGSVTRGTSFESDLEFKNVVIRNIRGGGNIVFV